MDYQEAGRKGGKATRGERKGTAKLTKRDVELILSSCEPASHLAQRLPVSKGHINAIRRGQWWNDE